MIKTFRSSETELLFRRHRSRRFHGIERVARRKLRQLNAARQIFDLASPLGNHLEALHGDRKGQHSIRINDQ